MLARIHRFAATAWSVVAVGAGLGFVARDLLGLPPAPVALAWTAGALLALALALSSARRHDPKAERRIDHDVAA